jgi:hypothetical protein
MTKVIEIEDHIESGKRKKKIAERRREMAPLLHFLQCSRCQMKCWRCGSQSEIEPAEKDSVNIPFNLCKDCQGEYLEYQRCQREEETKDILWRNREWKWMWEKWIEYQSAVHHFYRSKEVRELFEELRG